MQNTLIQRYLGNKAAIAPNIVDAISGFAKPGDLVFDAFSGSLAASAAFRGAGYEVACNDINHFSWVFAQAYFAGSGLPKAPSFPGGKTGTLTTWEEAIAELTSPYPSSFPAGARNTYIFDSYCELGRHSQFVSTRGTVGRRRFFSPDNAILIDRALSRIRYWSKSKYLNLRQRCVLTAVLISAVEKVSNTQGTFHDFPRDFIDERAKRPLNIKMPELEVFRGPRSRFIGRARDSLEFAREVPQHRVLYIDPPYNFRQYTSYYFMLNLLSSYAEITNLAEYFSRLEFVRGQNMESDFTSTFCKRSEFLPSLQKLIRLSRSDYVVLSYFDGRNHWGEFRKDEAETVGRHLLSEMFASELFERNTFQCIPVARLNYQSYGGYNAQQVQELLFIAKRSKSPTIYFDRGDSHWTGLTPG